MGASRLAARTIVVFAHRAVVAQAANRLQLIALIDLVGLTVVLGRPLLRGGAGSAVAAVSCVATVGVKVLVAYRYACALRPRGNDHVQQQSQPALVGLRDGRIVRRGQERHVGYLLRAGTGDEVGRRVFVFVDLLRPRQELLAVHAGVLKCGTDLGRRAGRKTGFGAIWRSPRQVIIQPDVFVHRGEGANALGH